MALHRHVASHHSFLYLWVVGALLVLGGLMWSYLAAHPDGVIDGEHEGDVRSTVAAFGNQLNSVSPLAADASAQIRRAYGPYVSERLLMRWTAFPEEAPGRMTSSPWPEHIEIETVTLNEAGAYDVAGRIILKDSRGDAGSVPVLLSVSQTEQGYRITEYADQGEPPPAPAIPAAETLVLALGETAALHGLAVSPVAIAEDSRCPIDAACVWQGLLRLDVVLGDASGTTTASLLLGDDPTVRDTAAVSLIDAQPLPQASAPVQESAYRFTFRVEPR